jgi:hypothetical protein
MLYIVAVVCKFYIDHCKSSSEVARRTGSSAHIMVSSCKCLLMTIRPCDFCFHYCIMVFIYVCACFRVVTKGHTSLSNAPVNC